MVTFLVLLLTAVVVAGFGGFALLPALLVHIASLAGTWIALVAGLLLTLAVALLLLGGIVYLLSRSNHAVAPAPAHHSV